MAKTQAVLRLILSELRWTNRLTVAQIEAHTLGTDPTPVIASWWRSRRRKRARRTK